MANNDYYKILGVARNATEAEIKKAYRKLARTFHPDLNKNDKNAEKKFHEINEANEVLSNKESRAKYDKYGNDWMQAEAYEKANPQSNKKSGFRQDFKEDDFSDIFDSFFGRSAAGKRTSSSSFRGRDFTAELNLNLTDVYETQKRTITVAGNSMRIVIPAGVYHGQTIKIKGQGGKSTSNGEPGDLYLTFSIKNNTKYERDGDNLFLTVDLDLYTALLGGEIILETLSGKVKMKIPEGTQNNTKAKLTGKGFPVYKKDGQFGDLIVTYNILIPTKLTVKEKHLIQELTKLRAGK